MNVVVIGFSFSLIGGLEIVSKAIASALAPRHRVTCLALHESGRTSEAGYSVIGMSPKSKTLRSLSVRFPSIFPPADLRPHLAQADAVIFAHPHVLEVVLPVVRSTNPRPATICWLHGREVWASLGQQCLPWLRRCDRLVAVSSYTADVVAAMMPGHLRAEVIHNPVDTDVFTPCQLSSGEAICRHTILTVGRHDADSFHKGYDVLIEAMAILRDRRPELPLRLIITGTGTLLDQHRGQIARLRAEDRVMLAGKVSRSELARLYRTSDVFAFPSRVVAANGEEFGEGFGVVNVEAAASGRPVITSTHGGCPETVLDGVTGFAVDPTSPLAVAKALETLFDMSEADRDEMGRRGREMALSQFSSSVFRDRVNYMLESVCPVAKGHSRKPESGSAS